MHTNRMREWESVKEIKYPSNEPFSGSNTAYSVRQTEWEREWEREGGGRERE